jgi:GDP-4-dehydro-6-deoxy-D-mannose reductase
VRPPILVTGAAGFAGSHLVERLSRDGQELVAWRRPEGDRASDDRRARARRAVANPLRVRWESVDLLNAATVGEAIARLRPSVVFHCAGAAHVGQAWHRTEPSLAINVRGTHHLLEALRAARVRARVVVPSSAMVYRPADEPLTEDHPLIPNSPYGLSKLAQELLVSRAQADGLEVAIARAFNHVGPRQDPAFVASSLARQIAQIEAGRHGPELRVGNLDARRDLTDVRDTVRAYAMLAERGKSGRPYNVCSGQAITIRELLARLVARARAPVNVRVDPALYRPNDVPLLAGDPSRIRQEVGWTPEIPIEQTLDDLLDYWRGTLKIRERTTTEETEEER